MVATREEATSIEKRLPVRLAAAADRLLERSGEEALHAAASAGTSELPHWGQNRSARAVGRAAVGAEAGGVGAFDLQQPLDRQQLGVDPLQLGRFAGEDVEADVVADRHLVEGAAEVGLHHRELLQQAIALGEQLGVLLRLGRLLAAAFGGAGFAARPAAAAQRPPGEP